MADTTQKPLYKIGSKGDEVTNIQTALGDYYTGLGGNVDKDYGPKTAGAVSNWQTQWNIDNPNDQIKVDGIVGPQTYPRLMKWHVDKQAAAQPQPAVDTTNAGTKPAVPATPAADTTPATTTPVVDPNSSAAIQQSQIDAMNKNVDPLTGKPVPTVDEKPDEFPYRFRWDQPGTSLDSMLKTLIQSKDPTSKRQIIDDYLRYMHDNNLPVDYYTLNDIVNKSQDLSLSPADDEKEKKRQANKERWDKFSNFLLHLGNAIGNVGGGGYASMKLEDPVQWGERQRLLKEKGLEQRRLNNQSILQQMQKNWADERNFLVRKQMAEANAAARQASAEAAAKRAESQAKVADANARRYNAAADQTEALTPVKIKTQESIAERNKKQGNAAATRAAKAGQPRPVQPKVVEKEKVDYRGRKTTEKTTTRPADAKSSSTKKERVKVDY